MLSLLHLKDCNCSEMTRDINQQLTAVAYLSEAAMYKPRVMLVTRINLENDIPTTNRRDVQASRTQESRKSYHRLPSNWLSCFCISAFLHCLF